MSKLELFFPRKPYVLNQDFNGNLPCVKDFGLSSQSIVVGADNNTCPIGYEKLYAKFGMARHGGEDLQANDGDKIYCAQDGEVIEIQTEPERGLGIGIVTDQSYDLGDLGIHFVKIRYWHLKGFNVSMGDKVSVGQVIGYTDNTGYSSRSHLHLECKAVDKNADGVWYNVYQDNGSFGSFDPHPWWNGFYSADYKMIAFILNQIISLYQSIIIKLKGQ